MLCQFNFKNFRSYKDDAAIDMRATSSELFADSLIAGEDDSQKYLPVAAVFGTNAGGKSNALKALWALISLIIKPINVLSNTPIYENFPCIPFEFDDKSRYEPTEFEIYFREKSKASESETEYEYRYCISVKNRVILSESLYRKKTAKNSRKTCVFERETEKAEEEDKYVTNIALGPCIKKDVNNTMSVDAVRENIPYLSFLAIAYNLEPINTAMRFFNNCLAVNYANRDMERYFLLKNEQLRGEVLEKMQGMGINISGIEIEHPEKNSNNIKVYFDHIVNNNVYKLASFEESDGTQKLFSVMPYVCSSLRNGSLLIVDELDAKLHPMVLRHIIMLFKNKEINKNGAQIIFTSHDVSIMKSSVLRTDEIWFACKKDDESSDIYSLSELRDENGNKISPNTAYDKQYLEGRYGADPVFKSMEEY